MTLRVLNVGYPFAPVGPDAVGGAEQVLADLDAALVAAGHRSIAHFVGLNARHIAWDCYGRPAGAWMTEHWLHHRTELYRRCGAPPIA